MTDSMPMRRVVVLFWLGRGDVRFLEDEDGPLFFTTPDKARAAVRGHMLEQAALIANLAELDPA